MRVPNPVSGTIGILLGHVPLFCHPHGIYRHFTTTVGAHRGAGRGIDWSSDPDGTILCIERALCFRTGSQVRAFDYVIDNASRVRGGALPLRGIILPLGSHRVFVTSITDEYPREVQVFSVVTDPLPSRGCAAASGGSTSRIHAEVMMVGASPPSRWCTNDSTTWVAREAAAVTAVAATAGRSNARDVLHTPVDLDSDLAVAHAELEKTH